MKKEVSSFYDVWDRKTELTTTGLGIVVVGLLSPIVIATLFNIETSDIWSRIALTFFNTAALWLGCRWIVIWTGIAFPWTKQPVKHLLTEIGLIVTYTYVVSLLIYFLVKYTHFYALDEFVFWREYFVSAGISMVISFIHEGIFFFHQWKLHLLRAEALEKENMSSKYETLKSQVNPHFLFNSLNTLTALIEENKADALDYVAQMSGFFRQILQLGNMPLITLPEELEMINTYYLLQQKRYGNAFRLDINLSEAALKTFIPPLTLQMLVENAVKHNTVSAKKPLTIKLFDTENNFLVVENNLQIRLENAPGTGTGLRNIINRYALATSEKVMINQSAFSFTIALPLIKESRFESEVIKERK